MQVLRIQPMTLKDITMKLYILIGMDTGLRAENLVELCIDDLEIIQKVSGEKVVKHIDVHKAKHGQNYRVTVSEETSAAILRYLENDRKPRKETQRFFMNTIGTPLKKRLASKWLEEFCEVHKINPFNPHCLRVTYGTFVARENKDPRALCRALGVKDEATAIHYIREADIYDQLNLIHDKSVVKSFREKLESEQKTSLDEKFELAEVVSVDARRAEEMQRDGGYRGLMQQNVMDIDLEIEMLETQMRLLQLKKQKAAMSLTM